jgi:hypothetical protein
MAKAKAAREKANRANGFNRAGHQEKTARAAKAEKAEDAGSPSTPAKAAKEKAVLALALAPLLLSSKCQGKPTPARASSARNQGMPKKIATPKSALNRSRSSSWKDKFHQRWRR